jgi:hypothetical protein
MSPQSKCRQTSDISTKTRRLGLIGSAELRDGQVARISEPAYTTEVGDDEHDRRLAPAPRPKPFTETRPAPLQRKRRPSKRRPKAGPITRDRARPAHTDPGGAPPLSSYRRPSCPPKSRNTSGWAQSIDGTVVQAGREPAVANQKIAASGVSAPSGRLQRPHRLCDDPHRRCGEPGARPDIRRRQHRASPGLRRNPLLGRGVRPEGRRHHRSLSQ